MLNSLFLQILNMSFTASIVILIVAAVRLLLKRAPKIFSYLLWGVVLFRLLCPFSLESAWSLLPADPQPLSQTVWSAPLPESDAPLSSGEGIPSDPVGITPSAPIPSTPAATPEVSPMQTLLTAGRDLWLAGMAALLLYSIISLFQLRQKLKNAVPDGDHIYLVSGLESPFVIGLLRPRIYLPARLAPSAKRYILLHEQTHIRRLDHIVKLIGFLALCIHWFNPLVWMAFFLSSKDMEMSCDESVIKRLGSEAKQEYSSTLLALATGRWIVGGTPLAFGEGDTRSRIKNVLHYKKPAFWVTLLALLLVAAIGIGLAVNPQETDTSSHNNSNESELSSSSTPDEEDPASEPTNADDPTTPAEIPPLLRQTYPAPYQIHFEQEDILDGETFFCYRVALPQEDALSGELVWVSVSGDALLYLDPVTEKLETLPEGTAENAFIRALFASRTFENGTIQFTIPDHIPDQYELSIEVSALVADAPGVHTRISAFSGMAGDSFTDPEEHIPWEAGKTYRETMFKGAIPDGTELSFYVDFTDTHPEYPNAQIIMFQKYSCWVFTDGQPKEEHVVFNDTHVAIQQTGTQTTITYTETDGNRFVLQLTLPEGWTLRLPEEDMPFSNTGFGRVGIYAGEEAIAAISYDRCDDLTGYATPDQENYHRAIFSPLMLGSVVNWDNDYTPLFQTEEAGVATCRIMRKDTSDPKWNGAMASAPEIYSPGILAYNNDLLRTIAIGFADDTAAEEQVLAIARSLKLSR